MLDYHLVKELIGQSLFDSIICQHMNLAVQADAIRVALLYKYGGFWIDTDIIILNNKIFKKILKHELAMIREEKTKHNFIGFIFAKKGSIIMYKWLIEIQEKVKIYKEFFYNKYAKIRQKKYQKTNLIKLFRK